MQRLVLQNGEDRLRTVEQWNPRAIEFLVGQRLQNLLVGFLDERLNHGAAGPQIGCGVR